MPRTFLITGADKGLGFALTQLCLERGERVFAGLLQPPSDAVRHLQALYPRRYEPVTLDVTDGQAVQRAAETVAGRTPGLDVLINNAGIHVGYRGLEDADFAEALRTYDVNSLGPLRVTQRFLPLLLHGTAPVIANISSEAGSIADCRRIGEYEYCMSKAALNMQSVILQNYLKPRGVKVLAIHPGWMRTDMGGAGADLDPPIAAAAVLDVIARFGPDTDGPIYLEYTGKLMNW